MKLFKSLLVAITLLSIFSCGGGSSGSAGSEILPQDDETASQTIGDTPAAATENPVTVPSADESTYNAAVPENDTTADSEKESDAADLTKESDAADENKTNNAKQDTTVPGNNDSGTGSDSKTADNISPDNNEAASDKTESAASENKSTESAANTETVIASDDEISVDDDEETADTASTADEKAFNFATSIELPAHIEFKDKATGKAIKGVEISVYDPENEKVLATAFSDSKGISEFIITGQYTGSRIEIVFRKDNYTPIRGYYIESNDIASISELVRTIELNPIASESGKAKDGGSIIADKDGDGIADENDEFPADKSIAKVEKHSYILAFEDRYPGIGDADFNDAVIKYDINEFISSENTVPKIVIRSQVLAAGTNKSAVFAVNVSGKSYTLIENLKADIADGWNTRSNDKYLPGKVNEMVIEFSKPLERKTIGAVPYDPYLIANGAHHAKKGKIKSANEIHLSFVKTPYKKTRFAKNGLTYALLLPSDWVWPAEKVGGIFRAYPDFVKWYKSGGKTNTDWYKSYDSERIFKQAVSTSSIAGYIMDNKLMSTSVLILLIVMFAGMIGLVRHYRLKRN
ncbi:MAG TPA: LruC domain-containing protein [Spirochaetota bacterium]|mgnify:CR=1 FL=1|nr:LruC domain-containing protein [Spirochaetota bacterium]HQE58830.1 LruC domain-containing protein [Spirochaetota bacterium]